MRDAIQLDPRRPSALMSRPRSSPRRKAGERRRLTAGLALAALLLPAAAGRAAPAAAAGTRRHADAENLGGSRLPLPAAPRLPTGARLDPAGRSSDLGNMPIAMALAPEGDRVVVLLAGWREPGIEVVEIATGRVLQELPLAAAFLGLAFSADGHTLYVAGGNEDVVYRFAWQAGAATPAGALTLADKGGAKYGSRFPAGLALSRDGRSMYVAENLSDTLAVVDLSSGSVTQRLPTGHYPYGVAVGPAGEVYVSAWGGNAVSVFAPNTTPAATALGDAGSIEVGRHPSALLLGAGGSRLFVASASTDRVAVIDTRTRRLVAQLADPPPAGPAEGSTPSALALAASGRRLLVAESDNNAVAVFDLAPETAGAAASRSDHLAGRDRLAGRIPVGWYPTAVLAAGDALLVANGKGRGAGPNPQGTHPGAPKKEPHSYTLGQTSGTLTVLGALPGQARLAALTRRVARANGWGQPATGARTGPSAAAPAGAPAGGRSPRVASTASRRVPARRRARPAPYPPLRHVVYIIKENRTYDQVFGDIPGGDGDPRLQYFSAAENPNHRALAARFGLFDHFLVNGEVSSQGHYWSTAAYATDFTEKTTPAAYSGRRGGSDDSEGAEDPAAGFLWDLARARGLEVRVYGEMGRGIKDASGATIYQATVPSAVPYTSPTYPSWDLEIQDQKRADAWIAELRRHVERGKMPALEILHLPNDHTAGARPRLPTPRAYMADNDLALGRIVEALSRSPFWKETVVFVLEDDAQDGPDHVDSHRAPLLVISPYCRPGAVHRFANTTDVLATIEEILGLGKLSQFDTFARPLRDVFAATADLTPYQALTPRQSLAETNPPDGPAARQSSLLDWSAPDAASAAELNRLLWRALKGEAPYPPPAHLSTLEVLRGY